ncbi:MAG: hypothetical protein PHC98_07470 [Syntrophotalea acetylenica]|jgi:hypothetical protein|uniref:Lipoprotein n=1 Tax=Syntrophotalea acetylenica TaxID=29542 RepID=A0A1L3GF75_SYNAC|nr:hypothetical protein [Syntrophotalea acetylenica]APG24606.1 hypothetical protein A7E75_05870 [Syntrophotalea acetylenica]APG45189.1 hypothetical protein A6070_14510 [Syntrophotalea acetylenica]MDD4457410.1 hypothetical protein [Syntrophotalea acetylenica]MDY0262242.1 hypothetical protein [Syntrophotalea acetylenica]
MKTVYLLLLFFGIAACAPVLQPRPADSFGENYQEFAKRLVWQDYDSAAGFMAQDYRHDFQEKFPQRGDIRILEIRPEEVLFEDPEQQRAVCLLRIDYYRLPSNTLKNLKIRLEWEFREKGWKIVSPFPDLP